MKGRNSKLETRNSQAESDEQSGVFPQGNPHPPCFAYECDSKGAILYLMVQECENKGDGLYLREGL